MSDEQVLEPLRATVYFGRKVTPKQYESAECSLHLQVPIELGDDADAISAKITETFAAAKSEVYKQLALDVNVDPLTLVVQETASRVLGATPVSDHNNQTVSQYNSISSPTEAFVPNTAYESMSKPDQKKARAASIAASPELWWDNSNDPKRNPKAPHFKSKRNNSAFPEGTGHWVD